MNQPNKPIKDPALLKLFLIQLNDILFGVMFAAVVGIMVFISLDEQLPAAKKYDESHLAI